jgi:hypothetical protein
MLRIKSNQKRYKHGYAAFLRKITCDNYVFYCRNPQGQMIMKRLAIEIFFMLLAFAKKMDSFDSRNSIQYLNNQNGPKHP